MTPPPPRFAPSSDFSSPFWTLFDAGARFGISPLLAPFFASTWSHYFAFEADPAEGSRLSAEYASVPNYFVYSIALSNVNGTKKLFLERDGGLSALDRRASDTMWFQGRVRPDLQTILEVPARRLDDFVTEKGLSAPDFLKLDVEGHEICVLEGLGSKISDVLAIFTELDFQEASNRRSVGSSILTFLEQNEFRLTSFDYKKCGRPQSYLCPPGGPYGVLVGCDSIFVNARLLNSVVPLEPLLKFTAGLTFLQLPDLLPQFIRKGKKLENRRVESTSQWLDQWRSIAWEMIKIKFIESTYSLRLGPPSLFEAGKDDYAEFFGEVYPTSDEVWATINQGTRRLFNVRRRSVGDAG